MRRTTTRALAALSATTLVTAALATSAVAQSAEEVGDYSGSADASVLELTAGDAADDLAEGLTLLDAAIAPTSTAADTTGGLEHDGETDLTSFGTGTNVGLALADELEADGLLVEATQTAPPDQEEPTTEQLAEVPAEPLLISQLATAEALARDCGEIACPDDDLVSFGTSEVTDTRLLPEGADGEDVAHLSGAVDARSEVALTDRDGQDTRGVQAQGSTSTASLDLFGGEDADALTVDLLSEPTLTAVAGGTPGSAEVTYEAPVVEINGEGLEADPGEEQRLTIPPDAETGEEDLIVDIAFGALDSETAEDGTSASGQANVLEITVLSAVEAGTLAEIDVAPLSAEATAPEGGVDCPDAAPGPDDGIDVTKDGPAEIAPGEEFDYTIDVENSLDCTLTDLQVVDEVDGPEGTEITSTDPSATVEGQTATFDDLDDLAPGDDVTLTVTVAVPEDAEDGAVLSNEATVTGDCDGDAVDGGDVIERPAVDAADPTLPDDETPGDGTPGDDTPGDDAPDDRDDAVLGDDESPERGADDERTRAAGTLPETGGGLMLAGIAAMAAASALRRRA